MQKLTGLVTGTLVAASCHSGGNHRDLVNRAASALGGAEAPATVQTISLQGTVSQLEYEQSVVPGGEPRAVCESTFQAVADLLAGTTRIDWVRNFSYPQPRTYTFSEIVTPEAGYVEGIDSTARTKRDLDTDPPGHTMSGLRLASVQRELQRLSPLFLFQMVKNPERVSPTADVTVDGVSYPAVQYQAGDQKFTVAFDSTTGLPARIRTLDYDNIWGDVTYDLVLSDWQTFDGTRVATKAKYELNGRPVADIALTEFKTNVPVAADRFSIPAAAAAKAAKPATGTVPYQWVLRRQFIGTYLDSDQPSYDPDTSAGLRLADLGPGIEQVTGGTHNSLIVEMRDHLIVFDAPVSDAQSNWTLAAAEKRFPGKPVKYLVLTHHHMDHAGGLRAYAARGATLIVGKGSAEHFRRVLAAPFTRDPDLPSSDLSRTEIIEVGDRRVLTDGTREVALYLIDNPHAEGMLLGYIPDARLGWVADLWSPGRDPLPEKLNPNQAALVAAVHKTGIAPLKFAGGHGSTADYAALAALEGK